MSIVRPLVVAAALLCAGAAALFEVGGHLPRLTDRCGESWETRPPADFVVVGVVLEEGPVGTSIPMHSDPRTPLHLRKVTLAVENVLEGGPLGERVEVFYFTFAGGFNGPRPLGFRRAGRRRVWWLRRDGVELRTACDCWDICTQAVESGAHRGYRPAVGRPLNEAVADVLLTRGEGKIDEEAWARRLGSALDQGIESYVVRKLRHLALTEKSAVRQSACLWLWIYSQDSRVDAGVREEAAQALKEADCRCAQGPDRNIACL